MFDITLVAIGSLKNKELSAAAEEYLKRLSPYVKLKVFELQAASFSNHNQVKAKELEAERIEKFLSSHHPKNIYLLSENGEMYNSKEFSAWINNHQPLTLVIGGALGFSPWLEQKYPWLSLSALTFPHELARLVLLEQIYRAATIINGKEYHY